MALFRNRQFHPIVGLHKISKVVVVVSGGKRGGLGRLPLGNLVDVEVEKACLQEPEPAEAGLFHRLTERSCPPVLPFIGMASELNPPVEFGVVGQQDPRTARIDDPGARGDVAARVFLALKGLTACGELPELAHRGLKGVPERIVFQERKQTLDKGRTGKVHIIALYKSQAKATTPSDAYQGNRDKLGT